MVALPHRLMSEVSHAIRCCVAGEPADEIPPQSVSATHLLGPAAPGVREANHRCVKTILP
jgi:hypothetical protein